MRSLLTETRPLSVVGRKPLMFAIVVVWTVSLANVSSCQAQLDRQTLQFVADVLTQNEYGDRRGDVSRKWATAPTLSTFGERSHHPNLVANVVRQLNECLPADRQIQVLEKSDESATLKVHFVALEDFASVADQYGFTVEEGNYGFFKIWWNEKFVIDRAVVLIAEDRLRGNSLQHMVLEEIAQSLGPAGDSNRFPESVFYEDRATRKYGRATRLSKLDRKTLRFLYEHVPTGAPAIEVGVWMARHWDE